MESDMGNEYHMPSNPKNSGKKITSGIKKMPCFVKVNSRAGNAFPIA